jgi:hypothetical protein
MDPSAAGDAALEPLEAQIDAWRAHLRGSRSIGGSDVEELEDHLREQIDALRAGGLSDDEAFLVAVKRIGAIHALTREFAREHSARLWKQLVLTGDGEGPGEGVGGGGPGGGPGMSGRALGAVRTRRMWAALAIALVAGAAIKVPALAGIGFIGAGPFYPLNLAFFTLPFVAAYLAWDRAISTPGRAWLAGAFIAAAAVVNAFQAWWPAIADTRVLTVLHLPIALWLLVGVAYVGGRWRGSRRRMDFVRFTGELFIYYVLIALGGMVLIAITLALFAAIGVSVDQLLMEWVLPAGITGATVIATWLVEAKQSVIENMAPVLTRIFTPLFTVVLLAFLLTMLATGRGIDPDREVLIAFDLLLVVVFGLLVYSISARDPLARPGMLDWVHLTLVAAALLVDLLALLAVGSRISEFGFTPNRITALGENMVLLANLAGSAVLYARFLRGGAAFSRLWDWQVTYLYVLAGWAALVAFLFPPIFGFR